MSVRMRTAGMLVVVSGILLSALAMKGLLEKKMWYRVNGKNAPAEYWALYFGDFDCSLMRKFPGEDSIRVQTTMNYSLLSSGYIEGHGYSERGKITSEGRLAIREGESWRAVALDDVESIYDYGKRIRLTDGTDGEFILDIEGTPTLAKKLFLRKYKFTLVYDEKVLKEDHNATDLVLEAVGFTKNALARIKSPK